MRKMKRLFKTRNGLIPWFNWSKIHFILNTVNFCVFIITLCFTGVTSFMSTWLITCMAQYLPIFIIFAVQWILETILYKSAISIIKTKLSESKVKFKDVVITVEDFSLHSCYLKIKDGIDSIKQLNELMDIAHDINRKLGNGYNITCIVAETISSK